MPPTHGLQPRQPPPELIAASWQRCRGFGLSPNLQVHQTPLRTSELQSQRAHNQHLRRLALREMHLLDNVLSTNGRILLLADANGVILDSQGDGAFLGRAREVCLVPGASWREQVTGTNAIGAAIIEKRFVQVLGPQHFFNANRLLACSAMPIMAPDGQLAGVLDISGHAHDAFPSAVRLVRHAVAHIEHDWVAESASDLVVFLHQHPSWLGTPEEGVLAFHDGLLTAASPRALAFLELSRAAIGAATWDDIFEQPPAFGLQELHVVTGAGLVYARVARAYPAAAKIAATGPAHAGPERLQDLKDEAFRRAVEAENGSIAAAARKLGVHRSTLYRRLGKPTT